MPIASVRRHPLAALPVLVLLVVVGAATSAHAKDRLIPGSYLGELCSTCPIYVQFYTSLDLARIQEFRSEGTLLSGGDCMGREVEANLTRPIPFKQDHTFEFHGRAGTARPEDEPNAHLDVVGHVESSVRATGTYHVTSDADPDCPIDISGSWVAVSTFSRPSTFPKPLTLKFSNKGKPLPLNLLFNEVNSEGHPLKGHIVKNVRCGKLRLKGQIALYRKPRQGCPFRQHATYTISNAKRTSKPARINVNPAPPSR